MTPTELALNIFKTYIPNSNDYEVYAELNGTILSIHYSLKNSLEHEVKTIDLTDPGAIDRFRTHVIKRTAEHYKAIFQWPFGK